MPRPVILYASVAVSPPPSVTGTGGDHSIPRPNRTECSPAGTMMAVSAPLTNVPTLSPSTWRWRWSPEYGKPMRPSVTNRTVARAGARPGRRPMPPTTDRSSSMPSSKVSSSRRTRLADLGPDEVVCVVQAAAAVRHEPVAAHDLEGDVTALHRHLEDPRERRPPRKLASRKRRCGSDPRFTTTAHVGPTSMRTVARAGTLAGVAPLRIVPSMTSTLGSRRRNSRRSRSAKVD